MTSATATNPTQASHRQAIHSVLLSVIAVAVAFAYGGLTSWAQAIPGPVNGLANTVSGWTMPVILVVWLARGGVLRSAITGALAFVALCAGYSIASTLRGFPDLEVRWALIGLLAGPVIGAATALLRRHTVVSAGAAGVLCGVLVGDAVFGFATHVGYWATWAIAAAVGVSIGVVVLVRSEVSVRRTLVLAVSALVVAGAYVGAFAVVTSGLGL